ncbi:Ig-like domain-containing protein, partial [Tsuneonella sp. HG222]
MIFEEKAGTDAAGMQEAGSLDETQVSSAMPQAAATVIDNAPGNVVVLPDGAGVTRITARGVDLVIVLDDGSQIVVPGGALNVPQIVVNNVAIPAINVAALLDGNEPQPAAGPPQSSGGNFASDPGALQAAYGLGDLLPYTEMERAAPPTEEVIPQPIDRDVTVIVITPDQPAGAIQATSVVTESALPARPGEPAGSNPSSNGETTTGVVVFEVPDGVDTISINGTVVTGVGQTIVTPFGVLTITDIAPEQFTYSYVLTDNTTTNTPVDVFTIVVTDTDGDTAQGSLTISITDDVPLANDDAATQSGPNQPVAVTVLANDIPGADGVQPSGVSYVPNSLSGTGQVVNNGNGTLVYVPGPGESGTVTFNYRIVDGDGDESIAKVTITLLADTHVAATSAAAATSDVAGDTDP